MRERSNLAFYDKFHNDEINFIDSDGGRMATGKYKQRHVGDCVTRAIAHLLYYQVSDVLENATKSLWLKNWYDEVVEGRLTTATCYNTAYNWMAEGHKGTGRGRTAQHGGSPFVYKSIFNALGLVWNTRMYPNAEQRHKMVDIPRVVPSDDDTEKLEDDFGCIVRVAGHITYLYGLNLYDSWDCSYKMVYGFWSYGIKTDEGLLKD